MRTASLTPPIFAMVSNHRAAALVPAVLAAVFASRMDRVTQRFAMHLRMIHSALTASG